MRDILVIGLTIAVILILARIIWGTPFVKRVREHFQDAGAGMEAQRMINSATECPAGSQMYMYNGIAFCCTGTINPDANDVRQTCRLPVTTPNAVFCTLGPTSEHVQNCLELRAGLYQAEGERICPPAAPNYVKGLPGSDAANGRCCVGAANSELTDCVDTRPAAHCDVDTDPNFFKNTRSCGFLRALETDTPCPTGYGRFTGQGQGAMSNITLIGCTDSGQNCYSQAILQRLTQLGYDVSALPVCRSS